MGQIILGRLKKIYQAVMRIIKPQANRPLWRQPIALLVVCLLIAVVFGLSKTQPPTGNPSNASDLQDNSSQGTTQPTTTTQSQAVNTPSTADQGSDSSTNNSTGSSTVNVSTTTTTNSSSTNTDGNVSNQSSSTTTVNAKPVPKNGCTTTQNTTVCSNSNSTNTNGYSDSNTDINSYSYGNSYNISNY